MDVYSTVLYVSFFFFHPTSFTETSNVEFYSAISLLFISVSYNYTGNYQPTHSQSHGVTVSLCCLFCHLNIWVRMKWLFFGCDMEMEILLLQHLKEDMKLSYLAHELQSIDRLAPQTWYFLIDLITVN